MGEWKRDSAGRLRRWEGGGRRGGKTKVSVKRVSREDLKAKLIQETGCAGVPGGGL